jgi:hypothetical protein
VGETNLFQPRSVLEKCFIALSNWKKTEFLFFSPLAVGQLLLRSRSKGEKNTVKEWGSRKRSGVLA